MSGIISKHEQKKTINEILSYRIRSFISISDPAIFVKRSKEGAKMYKDILGFAIDTSEPLPDCYTESCEWNDHGHCNFDVLAYYCFEITTKEQKKMKVKDLVRKLQQLDQEMDVWGTMSVETRQYPAINYNPKSVVVLKEV